MLRNIKYSTVAVIALAMLGSCKKKEYTLGPLTAPTDVTIGTTIVGQDASNPNGNGSGDVVIALTGKNVLAWKIDYDASDGLTMENLPSGTATRKYTKVGLNSYTITVTAYGSGATPTTVTKTIQVQSNYTPPAAVVNNLTGTGTKVWRVDKSVAGHFGVGPWNAGSITPEWWSASVNEKVGSADCFYSATFTFTRNSNGTFTLVAATPDGAFTKTGALAGGLAGIPATGGEACYAYGGGTSTFTFVPSGSGVAASASTKAAILLAGTNTFIGYGALQKEYEVLSITATTMYLRAQGTETGNAWYLRLVAQ